jgi:transposase
MKCIYLSFKQGSESMNKIITIGIDLEKNVFQLHMADKSGKRIAEKRLSRNKLTEFLANTPACLIGIEACGGAHYWARKFQELGHEVKMMAPQFVKPYVKSNKNDSNDAQAIAEAVTRPSMRFVSIKTSINKIFNAFIEYVKDLLNKEYLLVIKSADY